MPVLINSATACAEIERILTNYIQANEDDKANTWYYQASTALEKFQKFHQGQNKDLSSIQQYVLTKLAPKFNTIGNWLIGQSGNSHLRQNLENAAQGWTQRDSVFINTLEDLFTNANSGHPTPLTTDEITLANLLGSVPILSQSLSPSFGKDSEEYFDSYSRIEDDLEKDQDPEKLRKAHISYR